MWILILGVVMWAGIHLFPALAAGARAKMVARVGAGAFKGIFALLIVASVLVIVMGWRATHVVDIYVPPAWGRMASFVLVWLTFVLFVAARRKTNIKRVLRHPQLTGLVLWSIGHLFANGDSRSLILFTGLGAWAVLEMILISRREGAWQKPAQVPVSSDAITVIAGSVVYALVLWAHPWITGVRVL